jgi:hypothetical protein
MSHHYSTRHRSNDKTSFIHCGRDCARQHKPENNPCIIKHYYSIDNKKTLILAMLTSAKSLKRKQRASATTSSLASVSSRLSKFSHFTNTSTVTPPPPSSSQHIICCISENLARETCVASVDVAAPTTLCIVKQSNGQNYSETLAYLDSLRPDEILLNVGRQNSILARKVSEMFASKEQQVAAAATTLNPTADAEPPCATSILFLSRASFDQTKGAALIRTLARPDCAIGVEDYILLSSSHALLTYLQQQLACVFAKETLLITTNTTVQNNSRIHLDRATMIQLELLVNSKTGKAKGSLLDSLASPKTSLGCRLLRANLMAPPTQVGTIHAYGFNRIQMKCQCVLCASTLTSPLACAVFSAVAWNWSTHFWDRPTFFKLYWNIYRICQM